MNNTGVQPVQQTNNTGNDFISNIPRDTNSIIGYVGALVTIIANFLPFIVVSATLYGTKIASSSFNYFSTGSGKIVLICALGSAVLIALKKHAFAVAPTGFSLLLFLYNLITVKSAYKGYSYSYIKIKWGAGIWLTFAGLIALGVSIFLYWKANPTCFTDAINTLKGNKNAGVQPQPMMQPGQPVQPQAPVAPVQPQPMVQPQTPVQPQPMMQPQAPVQPQPMVQPQAPVAPAEPQQPVQNNDINNNIM